MSDALEEFECCCLQHANTCNRVPFSVFPSTYRNEQASETTEVKTDERITVEKGAERERVRDRYTQQGPSQRDDRYTREDIRITEKDRRRPRGRREEEIRVTEEDRYVDRER